MNAFEAVRDAAAHLYADLVASGADSSCPGAMVKAAIGHLDLELAWLKQGDPALKGARALFDAQSGTICCTDVSDPRERVTLVAHEIGHAAVHITLSSHCAAQDIDPSRPTEAAPVGLQRVEDYGARERRELQANVFAREFLLPRTEARRLHLRQGLGASEIADCLKLPKDLVRQQILDALLLPPAPQAVPEPEMPPRRPDPSQAIAAAHRGSAFLLQAGPGTGKTQTLIKRVQSLLSEGVDPASILILTFSNRAAGELAERIAHSALEAAHQIWIGTFHAFGLDLIRRYHHQLHLSADPTLFDRGDAIELLEEIFPILPLVHYRNLWDPALILCDMVAAISRAKDELTDPEGYRALAQAMLDKAMDDETRASAERCMEIAQVYALYERVINDNYICR